MHLSNEITWNVNFMQQGNFINVFLARHVSGTYAHHQEYWMLSCSIWFSALSFWMGGGLQSHYVGHVCGADVAVWLMSHSNICTEHMTWLSRPSPIQKLSAENHMLQLNIWCSWWWAYVPETCQAKNTLIKLPCCIKLAFQVFSYLHNCHAASYTTKLYRQSSTFWHSTFIQPTILYILNSHPQSIFFMLNSVFCTQLTNKHFEPSHSGTVKVSLNLYFVSTKC